MSSTGRRMITVFSNEAMVASKFRLRAAAFGTHTVIWGRLAPQSPPLGDLLSALRAG
jgi:hypothetical protein